MQPQLRLGHADSDPGPDPCLTVARASLTFADMKAFTELSPFPVRAAETGDFEVLFTGAEAADKEAALIHVLESAPPGSLLPVSFEGVMISSEAARELLRRVLRRIMSGEIEDRFIVLERLGPSRYNVGLMLAGEGLTAVERPEEGCGSQLLGRAEAAVRQTYEFLLGCDVATARDVQEHFDLSSISTATNRLTKLAKLALARRVTEEPVPGGGRQYLYAAVR